MSDLTDWLDQQERAHVAKLRAKNPKASKPKTAGTLERDHRKAMVSYLRKAGCIVSSNINEVQGRSNDANERARFWFALMATGSTKGFPDLTVIPPSGAVFFVEAKRPADKARKVAATKTEAAQDEIHARLRERGHVVVVAHDVWSLQSGIAEAGIVLSWRTARAEAL